MLLIRFLVLLGTLILGLASVWIFSGASQPSREVSLIPPPEFQQGSGSSGSSFSEPEVLPPGQRIVTSVLKITHKQKAQYTDNARTNGVEGTVTLRVVFLASGGIGAVTVVKGLPHGLTEQAIVAARQIRFEPEMRSGVPRTTTRPVSYTFNIY